MPRLSDAEALLGPKLFKQVRETPVLVVGAGGIGCELLKNLVLVGFANIEIIDLDTIDLSNLNRQFLFRKPDISKPKAIVAAATARHFNPSSGINIHPRHGNVKDGQNDLEWIKAFGLVMNALDNMDARRHVNKLCQAAGVPLVESGTAGYLGQVTPILRDQTECFDCIPKVTPKTFPVCTIRATPSEPIHCIVWAKTYLFGKLFGEDDEAVDTEELDKAQADGENADEIERLKEEAHAFREVRRNLGEEDGPMRVFHKVFHEDIERLLAMEDMWKVAGRTKPVPLEYETIMKDAFPMPPLRNASPATTSTSKQKANGHTNGDAPQSNGESSKTGRASAMNGSLEKLKDQKELSIKENLELFVDSCRRLSARSIAHPDIILSFDKDDADTLDFVLATANLRAIAYGIQTKTRFQVKEMAGNIIPAIATTNAIIAGLIVMQAMNLLSKNVEQAKNVYLKAEPSKPLGTFNIQPPDPNCAVCRDTYIPFRVDTSKCTLGEFVSEVVSGWLSKHLVNGAIAEANGEAEHGNGANGDNDEDVEWMIFEGSRILADPDFDDNYEKTLEELEVTRGKMLTVRDEDGKFRAIHFCIVEPEANATTSYSLPSSAPSISKRPMKKEASEESESSVEPEIIPADAATKANGGQSTSKKRTADEAFEEENRKKRKMGEHDTIDMSKDDDDDIQLIE